VIFYNETSEFWFWVWQSRDIKISDDKRMYDGDHYYDMMLRMEREWSTYLWLLTRPNGKHSKFIPSLNWH